MQTLKSLLSQSIRWIEWIYDTIFDNPKILSTSNIVIWKTIEWYDIKCYKFWNGNKKVLYIWWIHGNEIGTVKLMNRWINFLDNDISIIPKDTSISIIPCLNIDGYNKALKNKNFFSRWKIGKINARNVDLNRNFPSKNWSEKSILFAWWCYSDVSGWHCAWSEPEIQLLLDYIKFEDIETIYLYHNCWGTVFWKWTENINKKVQEYSKLSWYRIYSDDEWSNLIKEQKTWHSIVWAEENKIDMIEVELKTRWGSEWKRNKNALINSLKI